MALVLTVLISSAQHRRTLVSCPSLSGGCHGHVVPAPLFQPLYHCLPMQGWDRTSLHLLALTFTSCSYYSLVSQLIICQLSILTVDWRWPPAYPQ